MRMRARMYDVRTHARRERAKVLKRAKVYGAQRQCSLVCIYIIYDLCCRAECQSLESVGTPSEVELRVVFRCTWQVGGLRPLPPPSLLPPVAAAAAAGGLPAALAM
eukprot:3985874-Pyramimonas_sp.AAC.1